MSNWKISAPSIDVLERLVRMRSPRAFVSKKNNPPMGSIYVHGLSNDWMLLCWDYFDIEFKFEIYCISIELSHPMTMDELIEIESIPKFQSIRFLLRTEWIRPTKPGEVPDNFEQVIQEGGLAEKVPSSATAIGSALYGITFCSADDSPLLVIAVSDSERYGLQVLATPVAMASVLDYCDSYSLSELLEKVTQGSESNQFAWPPRK
jgi:hypothetical protein